MDLSVVTASKNESIQLLMTCLSAADSIRAAGASGEILVVENSMKEHREVITPLFAGLRKDGILRIVEEDTVSAAVCY